MVGSRLRSALLTAVSTLLAAAGLTAVAPGAAAATVTATFAKSTDWGTGYQAAYTVTNGTGSAITSWRVEFDLPAGSSISSAWETRLTRSGDHYVAANAAWNGTVPAGGSVSFGFVVVGSGTPVHCTVNGAPCATGAGPGAPASPSVTPSVSPSASPSAHPGPSPAPGAGKVIGYFPQWGVYQRGYHVKNIVTSGSAAKLTHLLYAFANVQNGRCALSDTYADYDRFYSAAESVDGVADTWDPGALRGNFNQLRKLKRMYPHLKVLLSVGGWTFSGGFSQAAANPAAFAQSCYDLINDPRWAGVFDGIDIDWEYPNACGLTCDTSGPGAFRELMAALRARFGPDRLVTAAITADARDGGKIDAADYAGAARYVDFYNVMTYDFFGAWDADGPTAPHSPLTAYPGIPVPGFDSASAIAKLKAKGIPGSELLLGIGFYGRGWTGVTQAAPGGSATGPAPGTYEQGVEDYKVLKHSCPATGTVAGTAYAKCGAQWWSYDTPETIRGKMDYVKRQGLAGAFFWELTGDTADGELVGAISAGLR